MTTHLLSVGKSYCLRLPDGRALGCVRVERVEDTWAEDPFAPAPAFTEFRKLFERADELAKDQIIPLWEKAVDTIDDLQIEVVEEPGTARQGGLRVVVAGNEASIGIPLCVS